MNHTPSQIMRWILTNPSGSLFTIPADNLAWPLFIAEMPDGLVPQECGCVTDTQGAIQKRYLASGRYEQTHGIQIRTRCMEYPDGFTRLTQAAEILRRVKRLSVTLDSTTYIVDTVMQTSPVMNAGQDEQRRSTASLNVLLYVTGN